MAFSLVNGTGCQKSAQQDADFYSGIIGSGAIVLPIGSQCKAEIMSSNKVRVYDGEFISQGRRFNQPYGESVDFTLDNGSQGTVRYDIIGLKFFRDGEGKESCETFVRKDVGESGTVSEDDIREGATTSYISMYRVKLGGINIDSVISLFEIVDPMINLVKKLVSYIYPIGSVIISMDAENPSVRFGGTWELIGPGRTIVCVDENQKEFETEKKTGGSKTIDIKHKHIESIGSDGTNFFIDKSGGDGFSYYGTTVVNRKGVYWANPKNSGKPIRLSHTSEALTDKKSVLPPYITTYIWERTA